MSPMHLTRSLICITYVKRPAAAVCARNGQIGYFLMHAARTEAFVISASGLAAVDTRKSHRY